MRTPPAYGALGFSKRQATALINGVFFLLYPIVYKICQ